MPGRARRGGGLANAFPGVGALLLVIAIAVALLSACGGDDDVETSEDEPTAAATGARTPTRGASNDVASALQAIEYPNDLADGMALGSVDAPATLQMFEDFQCPFCLRLTATWEPLLIEYVKNGKLRLEFRHLPILGEESVFAAVAAVCAAQQEGFWEYHSKLFLVQAEAGQLTREQLNVGRFDPAALVRYAGEVGLDESAFGACLQEPATLAIVQADYTAARDLGLRATPTLVLNGQQVQTPTTEQAWRQLLDAAAD